MTDRREVTLVRLMQQQERDASIPWLWGINGSASVLGSVRAIVLAMKLGFAAALPIAAACYFVTWLSVRRFSSAAISGF